MQEEIVNPDKILWGKIEFRSKKQDEIKLNFILKSLTTEWSCLENIFDF